MPNSGLVIAQRSVGPVLIKKETMAMKHLLIGVLALVFAVSALAGQNPNIRIYLDAQPPDKVHEIHPDINATFDVYVCLDCFGDGGGTRGTAFLLQRTFGGYKLSQTSLMGGLDFGDAETDPGWTIAAGADCVYPDADGIACIAVITYLYLGVPGTLDILPHGLVEPGTGREVLDCDFASDFYCIYANLGVSVPPNPGEPDCVCEVVEPPNPDVGIAIHVDQEGHDCDFHLANCDLIQTAWPDYGYPIDFLIMNCYFPAGFTGDEYSIIFPPEWGVANWQSCADFDEDPFEGTSGDGIIQWWNTCQPAPGPAGGPHTIGILTLVPTSPGRVYIWTHPATGLAGVYNCSIPPVMDEVLPWETVGNGRAGWVDVAGGGGCNPCICVDPGDPCWPEGGSPVEDATWGSIKAMYR
jgi:hypothetical protein